MSVSEIDVELFGSRRATARPRREGPPSAARVGVAGAGIVGCSIAYHLARAGAEVVIFEKRRPASGATWDSFAWINAGFDKRPRSYFELGTLGMLGYRDLEAEVAGLRIEWSGSVQWFADDAGAEWLREQVRRHRGWGYETRLIGRGELMALEPGLEPGEVAAAAFSSDEGSVDPVAATQAFLDAALAAGAVLECPSEVRGIVRRGGALVAVETEVGEVPVDALVVAAGVETSEIAALLGAHVPLVDSPGLLARSTPLPRRSMRVVLAPTAHLVQRSDGRVVTGADFGGGPIWDTSPGKAKALLAEAARYFPALAGADLDRASTGWRPMPKDGFPIVGFAPQAPGVYLSVTRSGVTLAPILGRAAALEILEGLSLDVLDEYRPSRFKGRGARISPTEPD